MNIVLELLRKALSHDSADTTLSELLFSLSQNNFSEAVNKRLTRMHSEVGGEDFSWKPLRDFSEVASIAFDRLPPIQQTLFPSVTLAKVLAMKSPDDNRDVIHQLETLENSMIVAMTETMK